MNMELAQNDQDFVKKPASVEMSEGDTLARAILIELELGLKQAQAEDFLPTEMLTKLLEPAA